MLNKINNFFDRSQEEDILEDRVKGYKNLRNYTGVALLMSFILPVFVIFFFQEIKEPKNVELYINQGDKVVKKAILKETPSFSSDKVENYAKSIMTEMFELNFNDARDKYVTYKKYFTDTSWNLAERVFENGIVPYLERNSLTSKLILTEQPIYLGMKFGRHQRVTYRYLIEGVIIYKGAIRGGQVSNKYKFIISLEELPKSKYPNGLVISELTLVN